MAAVWGNQGAEFISGGAEAPRSDRGSPLPLKVHGASASTSAREQFAIPKKKPTSLLLDTLEGIPLDGAESGLS